jgi:hypothetical protein
MPSARQIIKRFSPSILKDSVKAVRGAMSPPLLEDVMLHAYEVVLSPDKKHRVSLVIPDISARGAFGGVTTGIDFLLALGKRSGADIRIILDDYIHPIDRSVVDNRARAADLDPSNIEVVPRNAQTPTIEVRINDVFISYNWWITLNINAVRSVQCAAFDCDERPLISLMQDYEPQFYPFSSTHMLARLAFDMPSPFWGIFNSQQLLDYFKIQGHRADRYFLIEPQISSSMRSLLHQTHPDKEKVLLVYGRPSIPRNCFPAVDKGLKACIALYPQLSDWTIVSAGLPHKPISLGRGAFLRSLGKLNIDEYGQLLQKTAIGLSLMSSPHPSYPPLEMAHFGVITITNKYANKDLSTAHDNIISLDNTLPETIAGAVSLACRRFDENPSAGWNALSHIPSFLGFDSFACIDELTIALQQDVWKDEALQ